jgi:hypothetical protein
LVPRHAYRFGAVRVPAVFVLAGGSIGAALWPRSTRAGWRCRSRNVTPVYFGTNRSAGAGEPARVLVLAVPAATAAPADVAAGAAGLWCAAISVAMAPMSAAVSVASPVVNQKIRWGDAASFKTSSGPR